MSEIINLKQRRKAKLRSEKEKQAAENRLIHGRTKSEKQLEKKDAERAKKHLDAHRIEKDEA